jgi:hypothetical protein
MNFSPNARSSPSPMATSSYAISSTVTPF